MLTFGDELLPFIIVRNRFGAVDVDPPATGGSASSDDDEIVSGTQLAVALSSAGLPDVSASLTAANESTLTFLIDSETPVGTTPNVEYSATGADLPAAISGDLNIAVINSPLVDSNINLPSGYAVGFLTGGNATLLAAGSNAAVPGLVLIGASSTNSLSLSGTGTVIGGNGFNYITTGNGTNYIYGGTGQTLININSAAVVCSQGSDTITTNVNGSGSNATINASGSVLFFNGASGYPDDFIGTGSSTLVGFGGTISGGGSDLVFATGDTSIQAGAGASTIVGYYITTVTGGTASNLIFGASNSNLHIVEGSGVDTIVGQGSNFVTVGSGGAFVFGASENGYADTIVSAAGGPLTDIEFGTAVVSLGGAANNLVAIGGGVVDATQSSGSNTIFDNGSTSIAAGSGPTAVVVGSQNSTLIAGSAANLFIIPALAQTQREFYIQNFNGAQDFIDLSGFASSAPAAAFKSEVTTNTSFGPQVTVTLLDGTKVVFQTPANLASFSFQ